LEKKALDWADLDFSYKKTDKSYVSDFIDGKWDEGRLTGEGTVTISECAGVLQYCQSVFEGLKAYTTKDGRIVAFRPDMNASRM
jgi:branched-chain amino acid aminotransferase